MRDLYRGDGGPLNDYDQGWNDGLEAAMKALSSERDAAVEAMKAAIAALVKSCRSAPTLTVKENYRVVKLLDAAIKAAQPSAISEETVKRVLALLMHEYPGIRAAIESEIAAAQEGK